MYSEEQKKNIMQKYISEMEVLKLRTEQMRLSCMMFSFLQPMVEYKALQLRKVIEQILLASLIANADEYKRFYYRLGKEWNAKYIAHDLERINPAFFPKAVINNHGHYMINDDPSGMTSDEMIGIYEKLGKFLHSTNPFGIPINYTESNKILDDWRIRIIKHIDVHMTKMIGGDDFIFVVMNSSNHKGHVSTNWFSKADYSELSQACEVIEKE